MAVLVIVIAVLNGGGDGGQSEPAYTACVDEWNGDDAAVSLGRHQSGGHGYSQVQVLRLTPDASATAEGASGECAVIFAAQALDPEASSAAQIHSEQGWRPVEGLPGGTQDRLVELQTGAVTESNAEIGDDGLIAPI